MTILIFRKRRQFQSCTRFGYDCTNNSDSTDSTSDEDEPLAYDAKATYVGINNVYVTLNIALCKCNGNNSKQDQVFTDIKKETESEEILEIIENILKNKTNMRKKEATYESIL